jgi:hypothetical protein
MGGMQCERYASLVAIQEPINNQIKWAITGTPRELPGVKQNVHSHL